MSENAFVLISRFVRIKKGSSVGTRISNQRSRPFEAPYNVSDGKNSKIKKIKRIDNEVNVCLIFTSLLRWFCKTICAKDKRYVILRNNAMMEV